jgi:ABC-type Zn uptake system ZnuABC Zn-binding protein ZnuA
MRRRLALALIAPALLLGAAACGEDEGTATGAAGGGGGGGGERLRVVATTTQVADIARNVGGDAVEVTALLPPNADPHDFEPRPSDAEAIAEADLVLRSGGDLDDWLGELVESAGGDARTVTLIDSVRTREGGHGHEEEAHAGEEEAHAGEEEAHAGEEEAHAGEEEAHAGEEEPHAGEEAETDPHWWHDPTNGVRASRAVQAALVQAGADRAAVTRDGDAYVQRLEQLDRQVAACLEGVPAERRKLVTTHDALGYFAARYDVEVIGSVLDSLSTQAQPSAGGIRRLAEQMREERVRVLFAESSVAPRVEEALAEQAGARVGEALYADTLGPEGSPGATYLGSIAHNARAMADGFTGGDARCDLGAAPQ